MEEAGSQGGPRCHRGTGTSPRVSLSQYASPRHGGFHPSSSRPLPVESEHFLSSSRQEFHLWRKLLNTKEDGLSVVLPGSLGVCRKPGTPSLLDGFMVPHCEHGNGVWGCFLSLPLCVRTQVHSVGPFVSKKWGGQCPEASRGEGSLL